MGVEDVDQTRRPKFRNVLPLAQAHIVGGCQMQNYDQ